MSVGLHLCGIFQPNGVLRDLVTDKNFVMEVYRRPHCRLVINNGGPFNVKPQLQAGTLMNVGNSCLSKKEEREGESEKKRTAS